MCCVITNQDDVVVSVSLIAGDASDIPGFKMYGLVLGDWHSVGDTFTRDQFNEGWKARFGQTYDELHSK